MYLKVEDNKSLVRDTANNAILNTDKAALFASRNRRRVMEQKDIELEDLKSRVEYLEQLILGTLKD